MTRHSAVRRLGGGWFAALSSSTQTAIMEAGRVRSYPAGTRVFSRGDEPSGLYYIQDGRVRVTNVGPDGREALLVFLESPSWFGEVSCFDGKPRTHDTDAETNCELIHVSESDVHRIFGGDPAAWRQLGLLMASRLRLMFAAFEEVNISPLEVRLARRLLLMASGYGERIGHTVVEVEVSQEQFASMLFTSRQTLNQLLKELESTGVVRIARSRIAILDIDRLRRLAVM